MEEHNKWLNDQLTAKSQQLLSARNEMSSKLIELTTSLQESQDNVQILQSQLSSLKEQKNQLETKCEEYLDQLRDIKNEHARQLDDLKLETSSQRRVSDLYKQKSEELESKCNDLSKQIDLLRQNMSRERSDLNTSANKWKKLYNDSQDELEQLKLKLARQEEFEVATTSPSDRANSLLRQGISTTDVYSKYIKSAEALIKANNENKRLNDVLNDILKSIEEKAPVIQEQREEYERIMSTHVMLTKKYQKLSQDHDQLLHQVHKQKLQQLGAHTTNTTITTQISMIDDAEPIIDENLVTFRDVTELQIKNRHLLKQVHVLTEEKKKLMSEMEMI